jgi:hypothetical protein
MNQGPDILNKSQIIIYIQTNGLVWTPTTKKKLIFSKSKRTNEHSLILIHILIWFLGFDTGIYDYLFEYTMIMYP